MKIIKGVRDELEKEVLRVLISDATSEEMDAAIERLMPAGKLKLVMNHTPKLSDLEESSR